MADNRLKAVINQLVSLSGRTNYAIDLVNQLAEPLGSGDLIQVPSISDLTVTADGSTGAAGQTVTDNALDLNANLHPAIFAKIPKVDSVQLLGGRWAEQLAGEALQQLKDDMDEDFLADYVAQSLCYDASATYHDNVAGDALVEDDILNAQAAILDLGGSSMSRLALFVNPYGRGSIASISGFVPNFQAAELGALGIPRIGSVFGIPVFMTRSAARLRSVTISASTIASNVMTATVPSGHGIEPGMKLQTSGLTTDLSSDTAVTSVTATTVVIPLTASDGSNGTGTFSVRSCENVLMDVGHVHVAQQRMPQARIVAKEASTDDVLQVWSIWGRIGRAGYARVIHSPPTSVS